jgi:DNA-binding IscR family transcriptional regulator
VKSQLGFSLKVKIKASYVVQLINKLKKKKSVRARRGVEHQETKAL